MYINYAVLLATILFDGISYLKAHEALSDEIRERAWKNKQLLLGERLPRADEAFEDLIAEWDGVVEVVDFTRTRSICVSPPSRTYSHRSSR